MYAHKAVLAARCQVMSAMFSGNFKEGGAQQQEVDILETSHDNFLALLEYLYTDHAPIEDGDSVGMFSICYHLKDVPGGFPKGDLLGVTVALIHVVGQQFLAV